MGARSWRGSAWSPRAVRKGAVAMACAGAAIALAACGSSASGPQTLTLYNGQHVQTTEALVKAFEHKTGIHVVVHSNDESVLVDQIQAEGARSPADVIFTENTPALSYLQSNHLLAHLPARVFDDTSKRFDSAAHDWVGVSARVSVLVYNPSLIGRDQLPTSVLQLADPRYKGLVALAPGETDFQPIVTAVLASQGKAATLRWLEALKSNAQGHIYPDNESITSQVNSGQVAMGVINQYYWYRLESQLGKGAMHSVITTFKARDPGYVIDVSGAAVLAHSRHQKEAIAFVQFLTTRGAQKLIGHGDSFEYPIDSGVTTAAPETPFASLQPDPISLAELGDGSAALALLQEVQLL